MLGRLGPLSFADRVVLGLAACFLAVAALELAFTPPLETALKEPEARTAAATEAQPEPDPGSGGARPAELRAIVERPLFTVDRKPYVPPVDEPEPEPRPASPRPPRVELALSAVIRSAATELALLTVSGSPETHKVRVGEQLEGWTLAAIDEASVELENGASRLVVRIAPEDDDSAGRRPGRDRASERRGGR